MNTWVKQNAEHWLRSVQLLSRVWLFLTPWTAALQDSLSITNSQFAQIRVHQVSDAIQPSHPLLSPSPPAFNLSQHQGNTDYSAIIKRRDQKQNYTTPMCHWRQKRDTSLFFFFSGHQWLLFSISFHSLIPPTQMTDWPRRERRSTFSTYLKPHSYSWLSPLINSSPQAMRILALLYVVS